MSNYKIQSKNFLPENIRDYDFFSKLTEILDYVIDAYHTKNIDLLKALYDIKNANFDYERTMALLGSSEFIEYSVSSEQFKVLCILLSNLYEIKGTHRGIRYLLRLLDLDCNIYEWYDINKWYHEGDPRWTHEVPNCSIVLDLGFEHRPIGVCDRYSKWAIPRTGSSAEDILGPNQAFEDTEGKFRDFASRLLWVCVILDEIRWLKKLTDYVDVKEKLEWFSAEIFYDKYSPYVTNCPDTIQVGQPVYQEYPYIGDPVKVGDFLYKNHPFLVRSIREYNDPINYDGWTNTGLVGYSHQIPSGTPPIVGTPHLNVGSGEYWAWGYSQSAQDYYNILQHAMVGELWIEGDISPVHAHHVSGCSVSRIDVYKQVWFESDYRVHRGIIVGYEDTVQEPTNPGNSHVVDTQQGDILVNRSDNYLTEQIQEYEDLSLRKEADFSSNIKDLYYPFLVGQPDKFVGDHDLVVGKDYFFTWFELHKEVELQEQFFTTCLQVGSWGHAYFPETPYTIYVGQPNLPVGESYFVGINFYPQHFKERNTLLYVGTHLLVGSEHVVDPTLYIGQGFNYVGELAPWNATNFVGESKNIIYEWLETNTSPEVIEEEINVLDQFDSTSSEYGLSSSIYDTIWTHVIGNPWFVDRVDTFKVGTIFVVGRGFIGDYDVGGTVEGILVGNAPPVGYEEIIGNTYVDEDAHCRIDLVNKEVSVAEEQVLIEVPFVGNSPDTIGYSYEHPLLVGAFDVGEHTVGEVEKFVDSNIFVGQDSIGRIYTGKEIVIQSTFSTDSFSTDIKELEINFLDNYKEEIEASFAEEVFANRNLVGQGNIQPLLFVEHGYLVGQGLVDEYNVGSGPVPIGSPLLFVGAAEVYVAEDSISRLEMYFESEELQNTFYSNYPIIGGWTLVENKKEDYLLVGEEDIRIGDQHIIGPEEIIGNPLSVLFVGNATVGTSSFSEDTPEVPPAAIINSQLICFIEEDAIEEFYSFTNTIPERTTSFDYDITPQISEQFNMNENPIPEMFGTEDGVILIHPVTDGINPVYIVGEAFTPYYWDPDFNPTNSVHSSLTYTIEEDP